jgi:hypothetical protein
MACTASARVLDRHGGVRAASPLMCDSSKSVCANLRKPTTSPTASPSLASLFVPHANASAFLPILLRFSHPTGNRSRISYPRATSVFVSQDRSTVVPVS